MRPHLYPPVLALLLPTFLCLKPWIVFPSVQVHHLSFSLCISVISTFSSAIFTSSVDFIKLLFPLLSASPPLICPGAQKVVVSSDPPVLNLFKAELFFPPWAVWPQVHQGPLCLHGGGQARAEWSCTTITTAAALQVGVSACAVMPGCTPSASTSGPAVTASSTSPHVLTGHSCLHTSCFAHLGISVKKHDCAQLAAPCCLHVNVNPVPSTAPSKRAPSACELCQKRVIDCGPGQQTKETTAVPEDGGWVQLPRGTACAAQSLTPLYSTGAGLFLGSCVVCGHT